MEGKDINQTKNTKHLKSVCIRKEQKIDKDTIIRNIWTLFETEEEKKRKKGIREKEKTY